MTLLSKPAIKRFFMKIAILGLSGSGKSTLAKQLGSFITLRSCIWTLCTFCPAGWSVFRERRSSWSPRFLTPTAAGSWTETTPKPVMPGGWKRQTRSSSLHSTAFFASGGSSGGGGPTGALCGIPPRPAVWKRSTLNSSGGSYIRAAHLPGLPDTGKLLGNTPKNLF